MMPELGPRSQCGFGAKANCRLSPTSRTILFSASLLPVGTDGSGRFGSCRASVCISSSSAAIAWSACAICPFMPFHVGDELLALVGILLAPDRGRADVALLLELVAGGDDLAAARVELDQLARDLRGVLVEETVAIGGDDFFGLFAE